MEIEQRPPLGLPKKKQPKVLGGRLAELKFQRTKSSSTSTLYINSTVSTPDVDELLWWYVIPLLLFRHFFNIIILHSKLFVKITQQTILAQPQNNYYYYFILY